MEETDDHHDEEEHSEEHHDEDHDEDHHGDEEHDEDHHESSGINIKDDLCKGLVGGATSDGCEE